MIKQRTLKNSIKCSGIGLHSGVRTTMVLHPAPADSGIVFLRTDVVGMDRRVPARYDGATELSMCTTLANADGVTVATVEHLLAALAGSGVDNLLIELDGPEVPVMDGSAAPFVFLVDCADTVEQDAPRRYIKVLRPIQVEDGGRIASLVPAESFSISFDIAFPHEVIGEQSCYFRMGRDRFRTEISGARTFGFIAELEQLRAQGLARGGSLDNAVVIGGDRVLNDEGLRYEDEFVRHKVLDAVGDLYLAGRPILGHFHAERSGHALNNRLLHELMATPGAWREVTRQTEPAAEPDWMPERILARA